MDAATVSRNPGRGRSSRRRLGAAAKGLGIALASVTGIGAILQAQAARADESRFPPPGVMADVGGHRLHLRVMGGEHAGPTVVLEAGFMSFSNQWAWIQPEIARFARVVAYDRAGYGWSDEGPTPRDANTIARELSAALRESGQSGPYVIVGHSFGGLFARAFYELSPQDVAGIVFLDASHPEQFERFAGSSDVPSMDNPLMSTLPTLARLGVVRLSGFARGFATGLPAEEAEAVAALFATPKYARAIRDEARAFPLTREQVMANRTLHDLPIKVLSAGAGPRGLADVWYGMQRELAALSTNSEWRVVDGANHMQLATHPTFALATVKAVEDLIADLED